VLAGTDASDPPREDERNNSQLSDNYGSTALLSIGSTIRSNATGGQSAVDREAGSYRRFPGE
jgi:hypothetical protein